MSQGTGPLPQQPAAGTKIRMSAQAVNTDLTPNRRAGMAPSWTPTHDLRGDFGRCQSLRKPSRSRSTDSHHAGSKEPRI
jgi:hypothetical protein